MSREFLDSYSSDAYDKELVSSMHPYIDAILIALNILRILLVFVSYWKPSVCKHYFLMQMLYWVVRSTALIDLGDVADSYRQTNLVVQFMLTAYSGWLSIIYWLLSFAYCKIGLVLVF